MEKLEKTMEKFSYVSIEVKKKNWKWKEMEKFSYVSIEVPSKLTCQKFDY